MPRIIAKLSLVAICLVPSIALADVAPPPSGGCSRCDVDGSQGAGGAALALLALAGLATMRRRTRDESRT